MDRASKTSVSWQSDENLFSTIKSGLCNWNNITVLEIIDLDWNIHALDFFDPINDSTLQILFLLYD